jgi:RNA 3'-terminal phosphate cyclase (ATP)
MAEPVVLDGSYGEGGGQILRTALSLSAVRRQPILLERIRAGRDKPGLRPQHLAAVRAMAMLCGANTEGDSLGSSELLFEPTRAPMAGEYHFDISAIAETGSAGALTLLFQTIFLPLALAEGPSIVLLSGGTHVEHSPPYHYLKQVFLPMVRCIGLLADLEIEQWGWYPRGGGRVVAHIDGRGSQEVRLSPLDLTERGKLLQVRGLSAASNLPGHVIQRQRDRAVQRLRARHIKAEIELLSPPSIGPGTVLFILALYEHVTAGFTGFGRLRYPAEKVADDAADAFEAYLSSKAAVDPHLADQILLPLAMVPAASAYTTSEVTRHLKTNAWVIERLLGREITIEGDEGYPGAVYVRSP